jgi:hypothetical protein
MVAMEMVYAGLVLALVHFVLSWAVVGPTERR